MHTVGLPGWGDSAVEINHCHLAHHRHLVGAELVDGVGYRFGDDCFWAGVKVLPAVIAAKFAMVVVVPSVAVVTSSSSSTMAYMFWVCGAYPIGPAVLRNFWDRRCHVYAAAMNVLRVGYVFGVMASQSLNSFNGKMPDCIINLTALLIIWTSEYGLRARRLYHLALFNSVKKCFGGFVWIEDTVKECVVRE